jgi:hypothetical protein
MTKRSKRKSDRVSGKRLSSNISNTSNRYTHLQVSLAPFHEHVTVTEGLTRLRRRSLHEVSHRRAGITLRSGSGSGQTLKWRRNDPVPELERSKSWLDMFWKS